MQNRDFNWFLSNYDDIFKAYGHSYLAIKDENVLGSYSSFKEALDATVLTEELGTFIIQECNGNESAYTVNISSMSFV